MILSSLETDYCFTVTNSTSTFTTTPQLLESTSITFGSFDVTLLYTSITVTFTEEAAGSGLADYNQLLN